MSFTLRRATKDDRPQVLGLLAELFPGSDVAARHAWIHEGNPHGESFVWLAYDESSGACAGVTTYFPRRMIVGAREAIAATGGDTWVRHAFRRRGLGTLLQNAAVADMNANGIEAMFGTPLPANVRPLLESGSSVFPAWVRYSRLLRLELPGLPRALSRSLFRMLRPRARGARLEPMRPNDARVDDVWAKTRPELQIATVRDASFYDWRFLRAPSQQQRPFVVVDGGEPIGACALERHGKWLRIVDLVAPRAAWGRVFGAIADGAGDAEVIDLRMLSTSALTRRLARHGFVPRERKPFSLRVAPGASFPLDAAPMYATLADGDLDQV